MVHITTLRDCSDQSHLLDFWDQAEYSRLTCIQRKRNENYDNKEKGVVVDTPDGAYPEALPDFKSKPDSVK